MALKLKYTDEHGILHINMSPSSSPNVDTDTSHPELKSPTFDSINNRFGQYDLFGTKYQSGGNSGAEAKSLFRSRYNSIEEELANTPYAFTDRNNTILDIKIQSEDSPSKDIENDRFFNKFHLKDDLFGPQCDFKEPSFSVTELIHAQDRYFDLSTKQTSLTVLSDRPVRVLENNRVKKLSNKFETKSAPGSAKSRSSDNKSVKEEAFRVLSAEKSSEKPVKEIKVEVATNVQAISTPKKKKESSFAILTETTISSRPSSPRSLPIETRTERVSPFRGRGFREETSRHNTPRTSTSNSRANSPSRRRTNSLSRIEMAATAVPPLPINLSRPHSPRNFVKQNIEEVRELSELNREKHEAEAEEKRRIEEEALLREMGLIDTTIKTDAIRSVVGSRNTSRSNSPSKINLRSRSNSPSAILHFENIASDSTDFINPTDDAPKAMHRSRLRSVSRSQPQSNNGSPKHSKIPKRQNSVSPPRNGKREGAKKIENNLNKNQRFISSSTSSINDATRIETISEKKGISKSSQHLSISPSNIRGKPPISPGRGGPPPSNKTINPKRLSPIVGTPNRSPIENSKPGSARTPKTSPGVKKSNKTAGNSPSTSRVTSRQPSRAVSPDKKTSSRPAPNTRSTLNKSTAKPVTRSSSTKVQQKPAVPSKPEVKKPISRTNSVKNLTRTSSTKTLNERPPTLKRKESRKDMLERAKSNTKVNEVGSAKGKKENKDDKKSSATQGSAKKKPEIVAETVKDTTINNYEEIVTQDNETQYDSITNEKGELVILTKKNIVSMTTAAITAQPLEVVTTVTNQLPAALEKAREKGIFERHSSKDSIAPKDEALDNSEDKKTKKDTKNDNKNAFNEENVKLKLLQPPYNNPQVERVKQKIDDILKTPEVSTESILNTATIESEEVKNTLKSIANKTRNEIKDKKEETTKKFTELKKDIENQAEKSEKEGKKFAEEIRTEATKIVDSIITPVEEPGKIIKPEKNTIETKIDIEPIVMVVNEKVKPEITENTEVIEKVNESLVKGDPEVEVQSSNVSTPVIKVNEKKATIDENGSDLSTHSNGGFPQSTSTTPKPPARTKKEAQELITKPAEDAEEKKQNICQRLLGKCAQKTKCCSCCVKPQVEDETIVPKEQKTGMAKWSCLKKNESQEKMVEMAAGKLSTIEFQNETKKKRTFRDMFCGCCRKSHRVGDSAAIRTEEQGCFGRRREPEIVERRDSILSDEPPKRLCNNRVFNWFRGACRKQPQVPERRPSMFSKNKSLSPTLPPEDTRPKLDSTLIEHTSVMRGAIPVLPIALAYFCLVCNVVVPGLGTILSGLFCLCFGIPRFGIHDGIKHRFGSFVINLFVGCGQLFTVLFCLVGWGWSIWWGVIMIRVSRKYRKLAAEARMEEEQGPPVTANNHNSRA